MSASAVKIWKFRERAYEVSLDVEEDRMVVQVQDEVTTDQWRSSFEARHIEELTHKTGNFKQFKIFINMLQSAIDKVSDSVSLELLTYSDLENLRHRKTSYTRSHSTDSSHISNKRYLILTYSAEFDRIHYPLALPYIGKSDPIKLQEIVRQLKKELEFYKKQTSLKQYKTLTESKLQRKYETLLQDKENIETAYVALQEDVSNRLSEEGREKEIRTLKKIIKNLEENSLKEKTKHQRVIGKKNDEIKCLIEELEEVRASERLLTTRVKNLTNEISMLKRDNYRHHTRSGSGGQISNRSGLRHRSSSTERYSTNHLINKRGIPPAANGKAHTRYRSSSAEGRINCRTMGTGSRSGSAGQRRSSSTERLVSNIRQSKSTVSRTPSPKNNTFKRFDPTSYILNKKKRQKEIDRKLNRQRSRSNSRERTSHSNRASPSLLSNSRRINLGSMKSKTPSISLSSCPSSSAECTDDDMDNDLQSHYSKKKVNNNKIINSQVASSTPIKRKKVERNAIKNADSSVNLDQSLEIHEIDARLNALQQFMKKSLDGVRNGR